MVPPCIAVQNLLGRGLVWIYSWLPDHALWIMETCVGFPQSSPSVWWGLCALVSSHRHTVGPMCSFFGSPGHPPELQGLCVLESFVCLPTLDYPGLPSVPRSFYFLPLVPWAHRLVGAIVHELFTGWEMQLSLLSAPSVPALPSFPRLYSSSLGPPAREIPCAPELFLFQDSLHPSGHKLPSRSSQSFPFLCLHPLSYLSLGSFACSSGVLESSAVA